MDLSQLLQAALTLVVSFGLRYLFSLIGFSLDEAVFNALVAAIVTALIGLFLVKATARAVRNTRAARFLPEK